MKNEVLWQFDTCEQLSTILSAEPSVRALWLAGSLARGDADRVSDIDLVAVIVGAPLDEAASRIETRLAAEFEPVLQRNRGDENFRLLNFVTDDWTRFDLSMFTAEAIGRSKLRGLRTLFDKDGLDLPVSQGEPPKTEVAPEQVWFVVSEFIRVLGLLPVVIHRGDLVGASIGCGLLREHLVTLLRYEQTGRTMRGALNETKSLSPAATSAILGLPALAAEKSSIIEFNRACWDVLVRFGPRISQQYDVEWPTALVRAVRSRLARELAVELS
ncbi:nucleotidyltransferase domain-containing protein [Actinopolymorpha rutila]|uniref:Putative nucleotidyltransferase n=1 Tax=Actinopolymorpha rutila TaxID=446787 RepID=A0A852Z6J2_9ACTN|nr:putative nucleotidyltransferase [Actinopolymorpha rutila]